MLKPFGVDEGAEVQLGDADWLLLRPMIGMILEVHLGMSSLGLLEEDWFAMVVGSVQTDNKQGLYVEGDFLGCEDEAQAEWIAGHL